MRVVVVGAGAVGGVVGARLALAGEDVHLVARGAHLDAIRAGGLRLRSPDGDDVVRLPASDLAGAGVRDGDVALLAVKSQDTAGVLAELAATAPPDLPVVCFQNGVANEREALRRFERVSGVCVMCPATHLEPGVVVANAAPVPGLFDVGRYPSGVGPVEEALVAALGGAGFVARAVPDVMRWKHGKLLMNLANAIEAVCGREGLRGPLPGMARAEGEAVLRAAGIDFPGEDEDRARRQGVLTVRPVGGAGRAGGSSWQSLERGLGSIEVDHLNGEIVLLGRLHGVPTPVNALLQRLAAEAARRRSPPGRVPADEVLARLGRG